MVSKITHLKKSCLFQLLITKKIGNKNCINFSKLLILSQHIWQIGISFFVRFCGLVFFLYLFFYSIFCFFCGLFFFLYFFCIIFFVIFLLFFLFVFCGLFFLSLSFLFIFLIFFFFFCVLFSFFPLFFIFVATYPVMMIFRLFLYRVRKTLCHFGADRNRNSTALKVRKYFFVDWKVAL